MQSSHMKTSQPNKPRKIFPCPINHRELTSWVKLEKNGMNEREEECSK